MKTVVFLLLFIGGSFSRPLYAQKSLSEGSRVFVVMDNKGEHAQAVKAEFIKQLKDWGHWKVVQQKGAADYVINLDVATKRGMTAWSWGGVTVRASASIEDRLGEAIWQSKEFKSNPNGTNNFNTAKATIGKIVNEMKKHFQ